MRRLSCCKRFSAICGRKEVSKRAGEWESIQPSSFTIYILIWRGAGVVDRGALEKHCGRKVTVGSNPTLSAKKDAQQ